MVGDAIMGSVLVLLRKVYGYLGCVPVGEDTGDKIKEIVKPKIENLK